VDVSSQPHAPATLPLEEEAPVSIV